MPIRVPTMLAVVVLVGSSVPAFGKAGPIVSGFLLLLLLAIWGTRAGYRWARCLLLLEVLVLLALLLLAPAICYAPEAAARARCAANLKQIAFALHKYHDRFGSLPPAVVRDADGNKMHSWRVLILPYLGHAHLYEQYDFSQPWNSAKNRRLQAAMPDCYRCPGAVRRGQVQPGATNYVVVAGPGTLWPVAGCARVDAVRDDPACTLLLLEWAGSDIIWTEPRDLCLPEPTRGGGLECVVPSGHGVKDGYFEVTWTEVGQVMDVEGHVHTFLKPFSARGLAAFARHSDALPANRGDVQWDLYFDSTVRQWIDWQHVVGFGLWFLSLLWLVGKALVGPRGRKPVELPAT